MDGDVFGPSFGPWTLERAVIDTLQKPPTVGTSASRLVYYLADQERQTKLAPRTLPAPPGPSSYRGGVDANTFQAEWFPMLHVNAQPSGDPEKLDMDVYGQRWQATITSTHGDNDEDVARMVVEAYGTAIALAIAQRGSLGINARDTIITRITDPELLDAISKRQVCRTTVQISTFIAPILTRGGPTSWAADPYAAPGDWPTVETVDVTVTAVAPSN